MPVSILRFKTLSDLPAKFQAGNRSPVLAQATVTASPRVSGKTNAGQAGSAAGGNDAAMESEWILMPYPVGVNRVWRNFKGRMVANPAAESWKRTAANLARMSGLSLHSGPVSVHYKLHPKANQDGSSSKVRLDIDAPAKALLDALNGVAWNDDKQVIRLVGEVAGPLPGGGLSVRIEA